MKRGREHARRARRRTSARCSPDTVRARRGGIEIRQRPPCRVAFGDAGGGGEPRVPAADDELAVGGEDTEPGGLFHVPRRSAAAAVGSVPRRLRERVAHDPGERLRLLEQVGRAAARLLHAFHVALRDAADIGELRDELRGRRRLRAVGLRDQLDVAARSRSRPSPSPSSCAPAPRSLGPPARIACACCSTAAGNLRRAAACSAMALATAAICRVRSAAALRDLLGGRRPVRRRPSRSSPRRGESLRSPASAA